MSFSGSTSCTPHSNTGPKTQWNITEHVFVFMYILHRTFCVVRTYTEAQVDRVEGATIVVAPCVIFNAYMCTLVLLWCRY